MTLIRSFSLSFSCYKTTKWDRSNYTDEIIVGIKGKEYNIVTDLTL